MNGTSRLSAERDYRRCKGKVGGIICSAISDAAYGMGSRNGIANDSPSDSPPVHQLSLSSAASFTAFGFLQ